MGPRTWARMKYSKDPLVERSLKYSVRDGMACSAMAGAGETYLSAFALFLKASPSQVALLATLPALLGSLGQFLAAWLTRRTRRRQGLILAGAGLQGMMWLPILALPLLVPELAVPLLLVCVTLYHFCGHLAAPLWMSLMGDLVPERRRGRFFGCRTRFTTISSFAALVAAGLILHGFDGAGATLWGFVAIFSFAWIARMVSVYYLGRMHEPERAPAARERALDGDWLSSVKGSGALWFSAYAVLMQSSVGISGPFFSVYMLRELELSYLQFMVATGTAVLVQILTLNTWGRIGDVFGNKLILRLTSFSVPLLPALWLVSDRFWWLMVVQVLSGVSWAGFSLSSGNLLYELVPSAQRATYAAFHNVLTAAGVFLGGMLGAALLQVLPAQTALFSLSGAATPLLSVFLISALARFTAAGLLLRKVQELRKPRRSLSPSAFVFRLARFNAFVGLTYEFVGAFRRPETPPVIDSAEAVLPPTLTAAPECSPDPRP
jgi:MFS family permease